MVRDVEALRPEHCKPETTPLPHEAGCLLCLHRVAAAHRSNGTPISIVTKLAGSGTAVVAVMNADWLKPSLISVVAVDLSSPGAEMPQLISFLNVYNVDTGAKPTDFGPVFVPGFGGTPVERTLYDGVEIASN